MKQTKAKTKADENNIITSAQIYLKQFAFSGWRKIVLFPKNLCGSHNQGLRLAAQASVEE